MAKSKAFIAPQKSSQKRRLFVYIIVGGIFLVGLVTVGRNINSWLHTIGHTNTATRAINVKSSEVLSIKQANFDYLIPASDVGWTFDQKSPAFDKTTGVVKYDMELNYAQVKVTVSQQKFPSDLQSRNSPKFMSFVTNSNPVRSQEAGRGTVYFMAALQNGVPANGSDTVIFATDNVLLFGRAERVIGYDAWAKMLTSLKPH